MAETKITPITPTGPYIAESVVTKMNTSTAVALDATNGNKISLDTDLLLVFENTDAGAPHTITISGVVDPFGRRAPITAFSIAQSVRVQRLFKSVGWADGNGDLIITTSDAQIFVEAYKV